MMIDELNKKLNEYLAEWQTLVAPRADRAFFENLKPTAVGWKTTDLAEFETILNSLRDQCSQLHLGWVNERWLGTLLFRNTELPGGIRIIKLMQRRPGSTDPVGLDHVDFLLPDNVDTESILGKEQGITWQQESNGSHCSWLSIRFSGGEAKLRKGSVLKTCAEELLESEKSFTS